MSYDPFERGALPVGARTLEIPNASRDGRTLPLEIWYPATDEQKGRDLAEDTRDVFELVGGMSTYQRAVRDAEARPGKKPLIIFSHGFAGHRRQSTFLCTHLASHGYVVAAPDHIGNTIHDMMRSVMSGDLGAMYSDLPFILQARPNDVVASIDRVLDDEWSAPLVDRDRIGVCGHSLGGWTSLTVTASESRIRAVLPLAPAGGASTIPGNPLRDLIKLDWDRDVPTFYIVAEKDTLLPLEGMHEIYGETRGPKRLVVLKNADHFHFCDSARTSHEMYRMLPQDQGLTSVNKDMAPFSDLCPAQHGHDITVSLGLAHLDATLKGSEPAADLVGGDLDALFGSRGIETETH